MRHRRGNIPVEIYISKYVIRMLLKKSFALIIQAYCNKSRTFKIDGCTCSCDINVSKQNVFRPKCIHFNAKITAPNIERTFLSPLSRIFRSAI